MHKFSVWAPKAKHVTLRVDGTDVPMERAHRGNWCVEVESAGHGSNYGFLLNDDPKVYPDPRSVWQPDGVHGMSRVYDAARFPWTDDGWQPKPLQEAVIYELHVGTFTQEGTFDAMISKLPYLRDLGVTHVELMPVVSFDGERGWGYDGVQLYAPHRAYGGPEALQHLVNACHCNGLAVLLDVVYNHFGPVGNYAPQFGPYLTNKHVTPWSEAVNLEESGSYEVRSFLVDNAVQWLRDFRFDGLRLDAVHTLVDRSAMHFLEELSTEVKQLQQKVGRQLVLIAESDLNDPRLVMPPQKGGWGIDAQWVDDFHHAVWAALTGESHAYFQDFGSIGEVVKALRGAYVYDGIYSEFRQRTHGRPIGDLSADHFVVCIHNHDQVGNRAAAARLSDVTSMGKVKIGAAIVLLSPFVPMLFQGEEFAAGNPLHFFADFNDLELAKAVTEGRRAEHAAEGVAWEDVAEPNDPASFTSSRLDWSEVEQTDHADILCWYRELIKLRGKRDDLRDTDLSHLQLRFDEEEKWLVMQRGSITLACNFSGESRILDMPGNFAILLASQPEFSLRDGRLELPPESAMVLDSL